MGNIGRKRRQGYDAVSLLTTTGMTIHGYIRAKKKQPYLAYARTPYKCDFKRGTYLFTPEALRLSHKYRHGQTASAGFFVVGNSIIPIPRKIACPGRKKAKIPQTTTLTPNAWPVAIVERKTLGVEEINDLIKQIFPRRAFNG